MDYEKKYKEALERARQFSEHPLQEDSANIVEYIFPELKDEDERIRKELIVYCQVNMGHIWHNIKQEDYIEWLEKQGNPTDINPSEFDLRLNKLLKQFETLPKEELESSLSFYLNVVQNDGTYREEKQCVQKHKIQPKFKIGDIIRFKGNETLKGEAETHKIVSYDNELYVFADGTTDLFCEQDLYELVEQNPVDNVEPKFHEGEWITNGDYTWKIVKVKPLDYILQSQDDNIVDDTISHVDEQFHSFTIKDAKDGDVLCYKDEILLYKHDIKNCTKQETIFGGFVYHCCYDGEKFIVNSLYSLTEQDKIDIHPATKEQHNLLFQKMKEAGYEWDAEKLELKKIEQPKLTEFEDAIKDMMDDYRDAIDDNAATVEEVKERAAYLLSLIPQKSAEWSEEDEEQLDRALYMMEQLNMTKSWDDVYNWLKSLKERYTWKPSDEQMGVLLSEVTAWTKGCPKQIVLESLYNDLLKLKE